MRVGVLKGGAAVREQTTGLDEAAFYASLSAGGYPTPSQQCAKLYDRQTLGVSVRAGDAIEARNAALRSSTRTSAERARARPRTHATATDDATAPSIEARVCPPRSARRRRLAHRRGGRAARGAAPRGAARALALGGGGRPATLGERVGPDASQRVTGLSAAFRPFPRAERSSARPTGVSAQGSRAAGVVRQPHSWCRCWRLAVRHEVDA